MIFNDVKRVLIVGLGLLGGSYARSLHKKGFAVDAITLDQSSIDYALSNGFIDRGSTAVDANMVSQADLIVFAVFPHTFVDWIRCYGHFIRSGTIVTDVTGVKSGIVEEVQSLLPDDVEYIAAHPMAGREVGGVENSDDSIFSGANYLVVPTEKNTQNAIRLYTFIENGDREGMREMMRLSTARRQQFDKKK